MALAVSDGYYFTHELVGACAWTIASSDGSEWVEGGCIIPCPNEEQSSYCCSELGCQTDTVLVSSNLIPPLLSNGQHRCITTICAGQSVLDTVGRCLKMIEVKNKHSDLISLTTAIWDSSNYQFT